MSDTITTNHTGFGQQLIRLADQEPDRPALTFQGESLSRRQLLDRTRRLAACFSELGVSAGALVTIGLPNSVEFVESMLATWWLGATPQPISDRLPALERRSILQLAAPALAVGVPAEDAPDCTTVSRDEVAAAAAQPDGSPRQEPVNAPSWKVVTSGGSTGRPKLIVAAQPATLQVAEAFAELLRFPSDGSVLVTGPLAHNGPFVVMTVGLLLGNHVVLMPRFDASETLRLAETHRADWLYLVPTMMLRIWRLPEHERQRHDLSSLQTIFHVAAPCPKWLKRAWIEWLGADTLVEMYAGTELQAVTVVDGVEWLEHPGTVGRPVLGEIEIRDPGGEPLPAGQPGELWMRRGRGEPPPYRYIGASPKTAGDGWESLGDMGYLDADGYLYLTDRQTDMILVGGANVYPAEIEAALDEHPAVRSSCVIGLPDEDRGNVPHAIVELIQEISDDELLAHLRERLAPYKLPRTIERVDHPLRDDAGKSRRYALREQRIPGPSIRSIADCGHTGSRQPRTIR
jgi:bile acid-coenzyme A ligase